MDRLFNVTILNESNESIDRLLDQKEEIKKNVVTVIEDKMRDQIELLKFDYGISKFVWNKETTYRNKVFLSHSFRKRVTISRN